MEAWRWNFHVIGCVLHRLRQYRLFSLGTLPPILAILRSTPNLACGRRRCVCIERPEICAPPTNMQNANSVQDLAQSPCGIYSGCVESPDHAKGNVDPESCTEQLEIHHLLLRHDEGSIELHPPNCIKSLHHPRYQPTPTSIARTL